MVHFGIANLIPERFRIPQEEPLDHPIVRREVDRLQRIVEGQNYEIRKTLRRYSSLVEHQRKLIQRWRSDVLMAKVVLQTCALAMPERYRTLRDRYGDEVLQSVEREITLYHIDQCWSEYLAFVAQLREGIHLVTIGQLNPLSEFHKQIIVAFSELVQKIEEQTVQTFAAVEVTEKGVDLDAFGLRGPSSTWTYLINDQVLADLVGIGRVKALIGAAMRRRFLTGRTMWRWLRKSDRLSGNNN